MLHEAKGRECGPAKGKAMPDAGAGGSGLGRIGKWWRRAWCSGAQTIFIPGTPWAYALPCMLPAEVLYYCAYCCVCVSPDAAALTMCWLVLAGARRRTSSSVAGAASASTLLDPTSPQHHAAAAGSHAFAAWDTRRRARGAGMPPVLPTPQHLQAPALCRVVVSLAPCTTEANKHIMSSRFPQSLDPGRELVQLPHLVTAEYTHTQLRTPHTHTHTTPSRSLQLQAPFRRRMLAGVSVLLGSALLCAHRSRSGSARRREFATVVQWGGWEGCPHRVHI